MKKVLLILLIAIMILCTACGGAEGSVSTNEGSVSVNEDGAALYTVIYYSGGQVVEKYEHVTVGNYSDRRIIVYKDGREIADLRGDTSCHPEYTDMSSSDGQEILYP